MARIPRLTMAGEPAVYHIISRTALDGFVFGDAEKEYLLSLIQQLSAVYFSEVLGFCLMGNHFHLLVRMHPETAFSDDEIRSRFQRYYHGDSIRQLTDAREMGDVACLFRLEKILQSAWSNCYAPP